MRTTDNTNTHGTQHPGTEASCLTSIQDPDLHTSALTILTVIRVIPGSVRAVQAHAAEEAPELDPRTLPPRWALSSCDQQAHAIDAWADHPPGVWIARCGHQLSGSTPLYDVPQGKRCTGCARWSQATESRTTTGTGQ